MNYIGKHFYIGYYVSGCFGINVALIYVPEAKGIQFNVQIGWLAIAVGYNK